MRFNPRREVLDWLASQADSHRLYPYTHPSQALMFGCSDEMMRKVTASGSHYFTRDAMKVWGTRVYELTNRRFLLVSDKHHDGRTYRVAYATQPPSNMRMGMERGPHLATLGQARAFARELWALLNGYTAEDLAAKIAKHGQERN